MSVQIRPPRLNEVLPAVRTKLNVTAITDIVGAGNVFVSRGDSLDIPFPDLSSGRASRVVLMMVQTAPKQEALDKSVSVKFKVRTDFKCTANDEPDIFLENLQEAIFTLLQWQLLALTTASQIFKLIRLQRAPYSSKFEPNQEFFYNASEWLLILTSTDN